MATGTRGKKRRNLLKLYPKRNARWKSIREGTLEKIAREENRGAVRRGMKVRDGFVKDAELVIYGHKKLNRIERAVAWLIDAPTDTRVWLDPYGAFVWKSCDGSYSVREISDLLAEEFGEPDPSYLRIGKFLFDMESSGLLKMLNHPVRTGRGRKRHAPGIRGSGKAGKKHAVTALVGKSCNNPEERVKRWFW